MLISIVIQNVRKIKKYTKQKLILNHHKNSQNYLNNSELKKIVHLKQYKERIFQI